MELANLTPRTWVALAGSLVLAISACGDDATSGPATVPRPGPTTTVVDDTVPPPDDFIQHPMGADDVVLRISHEGGFAPVEVLFRNLPTLVVTGDGRLIYQGPQIEIYPGPLLSNLQVRSISEAGTQALLELADDYGLLGHREYSRPDNIADAPDTVVTLAVGGDVFEHRAYALGIGGNDDPARRALATYVERVTAEWLYGERPELGPELTYTSDTFLVRAFDVTGQPPLDGEIEPIEVPWPTTASVALVDAADCAEVPADEVGDVFATANQLTRFVDDGVAYRLAVKQQVPGDACPRSA